MFFHSSVSCLSPVGWFQKAQIKAVGFLLYLSWSHDCSFAIFYWSINITKEIPESREGGFDLTLQR